MYNTRYYTWRQNFLKKYNKIPSKLYKDIVHRKVH